MVILGIFDELLGNLREPTFKEFFAVILVRPALDRLAQSRIDMNHLRNLGNRKFGLHGEAVFMQELTGMRTSGNDLKGKRRATEVITEVIGEVPDLEGWVGGGVKDFYY